MNTMTLPEVAVAAKCSIATVYSALADGSLKKAGRGLVEADPAQTWIQARLDAKTASQTKQADKKALTDQAKADKKAKKAVEKAQKTLETALQKAFDAGVTYEKACELVKTAWQWTE